MMHNHFSSATKLYQAIQDKVLSSTELVQSTLNKIKQLNPSLNAIVYTAETSALEAARLCDDLLSQGKTLGPLHGVPFTVKDSILTKDMPTTAGTLGLKHHLPKKSATAIERLQQAGAIIIGKTNCPELELTVDTDNLLFGKTHNPWRMNYSAGSSSGGEAAAVASGMTPFGIGEDTTASLRLPAHYCGITTLKPTSGRVPRTGHIPSAGNILDGLWQLGPMARHVEDLELVLRIISGPDWHDPSVVPMPLSASNTVDLSALKIAYHTDNQVVTPTDSIQQAITETIGIITPKVHTTTEAIPPRQKDATELCSKLYSLDKGKFIQTLLKDCGTQTPSPKLLELLQSLETNFEHLDVNDVLKTLFNYQSDVLSFFKAYDVLICPPMPDVALSHQAVDEFFTSGTRSFNEAYNYYVYQIAYCLLGLPMMIVPVYLDPCGLPVTIQLVGAPWTEATLLRVGQYIENAFSFESHYQDLFSRHYSF